MYGINTKNAKSITNKITPKVIVTLLLATKNLGMLEKLIITNEKQDNFTLLDDSYLIKSVI